MVKKFFRTLERHAAEAWFPLVLALSILCVFSVVGLAAGQVQEVLADYIKDSSQPYNDFRWGRMAATFIANLVFAATLLQCSARLMRAEVRHPNSIRALERGQFWFLFTTWLAPWIGIALSLLFAHDIAYSALVAARMPEATAPTLFDSIKNILATPFGPLALAAGFLPLIIFVFWRLPFMQTVRGLAFTSRMFTGIIAALLPFLFSAMALFFLLMPTQGMSFAAELGPVPLVCISLATVAAAGTWLLLLGRHVGVPLFLATALLPLAWGVAGWDDNHHLRELGTGPRELQRPSLESAMNAFLAEHPDPNEPIVLVSTEGGGIRAAHFTAMVLGRLADHCPYLARRIFAISGVSGGSVGAAAYRASLDVMPLPANVDACDLADEHGIGPRQMKLSEIFNRDHLSPILGKQAFPELVQMFVPASFGGKPFIPDTDRQLGMERSLEFAFARAFGLDNDQTTPFTGSVFGASGQAPAPPHLLVNMTRVDNGALYVASAIDLSAVEGRDEWVHDFRCLWPQPENAEGGCSTSADYRLSTIAGTSARFPVISPAGTIQVEDEGVRRTYRFVDGGYFDNSGIESLFGVIDTLRVNEELWARIRPRLIVLHIDSNPVPTSQQNAADTRSASPMMRVAAMAEPTARRQAWRPDFDIHELEAVLAAREQRILISYNNLRRLAGDGAAPEAQICGLSMVSLQEGGGITLRLGWILSRPAATEIQRQAAHALSEEYANQVLMPGACQPQAARRLAAPAHD